MSDSEYEWLWMIMNIEIDSISEILHNLFTIQSIHACPKFSHGRTRGFKI